jgi:tetratricopeptide (TPR) repeat protein
MRRLSLILMALMLVGFVPRLLAQNPTPTPSPAQDSADRAEAAAQRAEKAADNADKAVSDAQGLVDLANTLMGLFQNVTAVTGLLIPLLVVVGGLVGLNRLSSAQQELTEARERFEKDVKEKQGELDALRDQLTKSAAEQRNDADRASLAQSLLPMGERQYRAQDYVGALDTYRRALELDPDNLIIHYRLGYVYTQAGQLEDAKKHLVRALEIEPNFAPGLAALGYVYRRIGEKMPQGIERDQMLNEAERHFLEALRISPKVVDEDNESWWGALGGLYRRRGQIDQAIYAYERGGEVTPHSSYPFSNLALLYMQKHDRDAMLRTYKRVEKLAYGEVQADVENYWAYADLVVARLAIGKVKEAEDVLDTTLETAPEDSPYTLESLLDTLTRLSEALKPEEIASVTRVMERIRQFRDARLAKQQAQAAAAASGDDQTAGAN